MAPIIAAYRDAKPNREKTLGKAISVVKANLNIAGVVQSCDVASGDKAATCTIQIPRGPAERKNWFFGQDGAERGAYFVYVERVNS